MKIIAGMATFGNRPVQKAIDSLVNQVDMIYLYDNEVQPNLTDNGKFFGLTQINDPCYYFTVDDDIEYPPNYIEKTIIAIEKHKCIISHHGRILIGLNRPYYHGHKAIIFNGKSDYEGILHVAGTGVTGFRTDYFNPVGLHQSKDQKMSDVIFSLEAAKQGKRIMTIPHAQGWLKQLKVETEQTIKHTMRNNQTRLNVLANEIFTILAL